MRVSDRQFVDLSYLWVNRTRLAAHEASQRVQTGRRVLKPSDDPAASAAALRESAEANRNASTLATVQYARLVTENAEASLDSVGGILNRLGELSVQASNSTLSAVDRANIAREVAALRDELLSLANTNTNGAYIFGGFVDDQVPFANDGSYQGSQQVREIAVSPGVRVPVGITGQVAFDPPGGVSMFGVVDTFLAALEADDVETVRESIDDIRQASAQIADARARLGAYIDSFMTAESVLERTRDEAVARRSSLIDSGVKEIFDYKQAEHAVDTAMTIASQLPLTGLVGRG